MVGRLVTLHVVTDHPHGHMVGRSVTLHEAFLTTVGILNPTIGNPESLKIQTF